MWKELNPELRKDYFKQIIRNIKSLDNKKVLSPKLDLVFRCFDLTPLKEVKVVILGQDPYPNRLIATGLSFGVPSLTKNLPPSLKNIIKELDTELKLKLTDITLESWANQGVLLLNSHLTTITGSSLDHKHLHWERFTNEVIKLIDKKEEPVVFLLWGNFAIKKSILIKNPNHLVLKTTHPSPFSAKKGFLGCNHFIKCNEFLKTKGLIPISWVKR